MKEEEEFVLPTDSQQPPPQITEDYRNENKAV